MSAPTRARRSSQKRIGAGKRILTPIARKLFDGLNRARNKRSLAHDNELLADSETELIIDCVLASLAFTSE